MARPSSRSYYGAGAPGDDYAADLQHLQHQYNAQQQQQQQHHQLQQSQYASMQDSHVGINMGALDAQQQQAHYAPPPGSSSGASRQGQMLGSPMSGTGAGSQSSHSAFTSPRQSYGDLSAQHNSIPGGYAPRPGSSSAHGPGTYDAVGSGSMSGIGAGIGLPSAGLGRSASISSGHHSASHSAHHTSPLHAQNARLSSGGGALASPVHSLSLHQQQQQGAYGSPLTQSHSGQAYAASYQQQLQQQQQQQMQQQQLQQQHQQARRSREYSRSSEHGFPGGSNSAFALSGRQSHSALLPTTNAGAVAEGSAGGTPRGAYSPNNPSSVFGTPASASRSPSGGSQNRGSQRPLSYAPPPPGPPSSAGGGSGFQTAPSSRMSIHGTEHASTGGAAGGASTGAGGGSAYLDMGDGMMRGSRHASPAGPSSSLSRSSRDIGGSVSELPLHNPHYDPSGQTLSSISSRNIAGLGSLGAAGTDVLPFAYSSRKGSNASSGLPLYAHTGHHAYPNNAGSGLPPSASSSSLATSGYAYGAGTSAGPPPAATRPPPQEGFRRVRDLSDLKPDTEKASVGKGRRADPAGDFVSVSLNKVEQRGMDYAHIAFLTSRSH